MRELKFIKRANIRQVYIRDLIITMITPELDYEPLIIDLNKAKNNDQKMINLLKENGIDDITKYKDDDSISTEIIQEFGESGWRYIIE